MVANTASHAKPRRRGQRGRRRAAYNAAAFTLVGLIALFVVAKTVTMVEVPNPVVGAPLITLENREALTITWLGDTFLGDAAQPFIDEFGPDWPGSLLLPIPTGNVVIANLEGPLTERTDPFDPLQRWSYNSAPSAAGALTTLGVDAISLANNHAMDRGPEGLDDTITNAESVGLHSFGGGASSEEARLPLLVDSGDLTVAVLGFSDDSGLKVAAQGQPGARRLSRTNLTEDIKRARAGGADRVVAAVHWGANYTGVDPRQEAWAQAFADAGYDLVVGTGPHVVQPIRIVGNMPVAYSIGNYIFGTPGRFSEPFQGFGLILSTTFSEANTVEVTVGCIQNDNKLVNYQPRPCDEAQSLSLLPAVNAGLTISGSQASMTLPLPAVTK